MRTTRRDFLKLAGGLVAGVALPDVLPRSGAALVRAQAIAGATTFKGDATTTALGPFALNTGLAVVRVQSNGVTNFALSLIQPEPGQGANGSPVTGGFFGLFNQIGAFKGGAVALVGVPGPYFFQVSATGAFQLSIEQPLPETVNPVQQTTFSGKGADITPYFTLPDGITQISMQSPSRFIVASMYHLDDLGGAVVEAGLMGEYNSIFDFRDPANQPSFPLTLPDNGPYILVTTNDISDQTTWTIAFS